MEWLIVLVAVPLVVVPIVLLFGFAGCGLFVDFEKYDTSPPTPDPALDVPYDLVATALDTDRIALTWKHKFPGKVNFVVARQEAAQPRKDLPPVGQGIATFYDDQTALEGQTYTYWVRATNPVTGVTSGDSSPAVARAWRRVMVYGGQDRLLSSDDLVLAGHCLVQRIDQGTYVRFTGTVQTVTLTLRGSANANPGQALVLDEVSLAHAVGPGAPGTPPPNAWDSDPSGMHRFGRQALPGTGVPIQLPEVAFPLDPARDLVVAFDIADGNANNTRRRPITSGETSRAFNRANTDEAGAADRTPLAGATNPTPAYQMRPAGVYLVERIDVLIA